MHAFLMGKKSVLTNLIELAGSQAVSNMQGTTDLSLSMRKMRQQLAARAECLITGYCVSIKEPTVYI